MEKVFLLSFNYSVWTSCCWATSYSSFGQIIAFTTTIRSLSVIIDISVSYCWCVLVSLNKCGNDLKLEGMDVYNTYRISTYIASTVMQCSARVCTFSPTVLSLPHNISWWLMLYPSTSWPHLNNNIFYIVENKCITLPLVTTGLKL